MDKKEKKMQKEDFYQESLLYHAKNPKGKIAIALTKPLANQHELSLAYTPGVAEPCRKIHENHDLAFEYTSKGNFVAVISNGTAVLGLGNLGALASKPVMEGKVALFKRFADIDAIDIEVSTENPEEFINCVKYLGASWGGINLEDIKAPECFIIERELKKHMDIPVFHDDQHGTAIITCAGIINAAELTNRKLDKMRVVVNGAGAAAIACSNLLISIGVKKENLIMCDSKGVIYKGRKEGMNEWKEAFAVDTQLRTLEDAVNGADVFIGLSVKGALSKEMVKKMADAPIIFAMANPEPEITPEEAREAKHNAIIATGRSDYHNQVNNVMGFPYIFRGALDVQARVINDEMKVAAVYAIANLAKQNITEEIELAYGSTKCGYGSDYIIPVPFDSRLIQEVSSAVAEAAMKSGVARKEIKDMNAYKQELAARLNPGAKLSNHFFKYCVEHPKTIIFVEGEEEQMIKAAVEWYKQSCGNAILIGHEDVIRDGLAKLGMYDLPEDGGIVIDNAAISKNTNRYIDALYQKLQRHGFLLRDCMRLVKRDRNVYAGCMLNAGIGDGMVTGLTRGYLSNVDDIIKIIDLEENKTLCGISTLLKDDRVIFISDTTINERPTPQQLVDITLQAVEEVRAIGHTPRVAFISYSNFGTRIPNYEHNTSQQAIAILNKMSVNFEYDGEMCANTALNKNLLAMYPFCKLSGPANVLIMPDLNSASIASKILQEFGNAVMMGPILSGFSKSVQIVSTGSSTLNVFNAAMIASTRAKIKAK